MFYILTENRVLEPYRPRRVVERSSPSENAKEVKDHEESKSFYHALKNSLEHPADDTPVDFVGRQNVIKAYEEQMDVGPKKHPITVDQVMSSPVLTVSEFTSVEDLKKLMKENGFAHFPVVSRDNHLVGVVSEMDMLAHPTGKSSDIMAKKIVTVGAKAPLRQAVAIMLHERIPCLPVIDSSRVAIGILTTTDILKMLLVHTPLEVWR